MFNSRAHELTRALRSWLAITFFLAIAINADAAEKISIVPKWSQFERTFKSGVNYEKPFQNCTLSAVFTSPTGETNLIYGFWDGGKTWKLRFAPDQPGHWSYRTSCSDPANRNLRNQSGEFICTAPVATNRFQLHGPLRVARDHSHFEHEDGTPFFWMADFLGNGMRLGSPVELNAYARVRAVQRFTAAQWSVTPGRDLQNQAAFFGRPEITPNPEFFQRLDEKIDVLNRAGLLSVIAPLWNAPRDSIEAVPEEQLVLLMRYVAARWSSFNVAWLLNSNTNVYGAMLPKLAAELKSDHTPIVVFQDQLPKRNELPKDADAIGYAATQSQSNQLTRTGTALPIVAVVSPSENAPASSSEQRITDDIVRETAWKNLIDVSSVGMIYTSDAVENWRPEKTTKADDDLALWQKSMFLPGAKQMSVAADFFSAIPFWQLQPAEEMLTSRNSGISAAATPSQSFAVFYVPKDATLELTIKALPATPEIRWLNPRTGQRTPATAVIGPNSVKFPSPESADWVLLLRAKR